MKHLNYLFLATLIAFFSTCSKEEDPPPPKVGSLAGVIISDGIPVSGASITISLNNVVVSTATSGSSGLFSFSGLEVGSYVIDVSKDGFLDAQKTTTVTDGGITQVEFELIAEDGDIDGSVVDSNTGLGVEDVNVSLQEGGSEVSSTTTDASGLFGFTDVNIGDYDLVFTKNGYEELTEMTTVLSNQIATVDVTMVRLIGTLQVTVIDNFGGSIDNATVNLLEEGNVIDTDFLGFGENVALFEDIPVGDYDITITRSGFDDAETTATVETGLTTEIEVQLEPFTLPSGGVAGSRVITNTTTSATFELDVFVLDEDGNDVTNLSTADFILNDGNFGSFFFDFTLVSTVFTTLATSSPYSAALLIDQSGSISGTDPNDSRVQAAKIFLGALGTGDNATLAAFSGAGFLGADLVTYGGFNSDGTVFFDAADNLKNLEGGGTPLFKSTLDMINFTAAGAPNANKAVIVFTDGEDTSGGATIDDVANASAGTGVKVFTVGLGTGTDILTLGEMAVRGNGAYMRASDAAELVTLFGSLGNILGGSFSFYTVQWTVAVNGVAFPANFSTTFTVNTPNGSITVPLFVMVTLANSKIGGSVPTYTNLPKVHISDY